MTVRVSRLFLFGIASRLGLFQIRGRAPTNRLYGSHPDAWVGADLRSALVFRSGNFVVFNDSAPELKRTRLTQPITALIMDISEMANMRSGAQAMDRSTAPTAEKTVFISYRRSVSRHIARSVFMDLRFNGYDVFMDVESIDSGIFDTIILNQIAARAHFILILTKGSLDRCTEPSDWLRREIDHAIALRRNVVPLLFDDFQFDAGARRILTGRLEPLLHYNALPVPHEYFEEAMQRLRTRFLRQPVLGPITAPPPREEVIVRRKIASLVRETQDQQPPPPTLIAPPLDPIIQPWRSRSPRLQPVTRSGSDRRKDIEARVIAALSDLLGADSRSITARTRFVEDLEADSLDLIELTMILEEEFDGEIPDEDALRITTVGDAVAYIDAHMA